MEPDDLGAKQPGVYAINAPSNLLAKQPGNNANSVPSISDIWLIWPDGFMVPWDERNIDWARSDDYKLVDVLSYDESDHPATWQ